MDRVKLGRALGYGTRHAAKTLAAVAEAATAPGPQRDGRLETRAEREPPRSAEPNSGGRSMMRSPEAPRRPTATQVRGAGRSMWAPLATFSSALWLRVTGCFFGLVALTMTSGAWRLRGALRAGADPAGAQHFWIFVAVAVLFGYFAVSSFMRASRRERRAVSDGAR